MAKPEVTENPHRPRTLSHLLFKLLTREVPASNDQLLTQAKKAGFNPSMATIKTYISNFRSGKADPHFGPREMIDGRSCVRGRKGRIPIKKVS